MTKYILKSLKVLPVKSSVVTDRTKAVSKSGS